MVASGRVAYPAQRAGDYGVQTALLAVDLAKVRERKQNIVNEWRGDTVKRISAKQVQAARPSEGDHRWDPCLPRVLAKRLDQVTRVRFPPPPPRTPLHHAARRRARPHFLWILALRAVEPDCTPLPSSG